MERAPDRSRRDPLPEASVAPAEKWEANREKVAFAAAFPGRLTEWTAAVGKTVEAVAPSDGMCAVVFTDGTFMLTPPPDPAPAAILSALAAARDRLEGRHREAFAALDRLIARDRDLTRAAKLERILGAIRHNAAEIPELKDAVQALLDHWNVPPSHAEKD